MFNAVFESPVNAGSLGKKCGNVVRVQRGVFGKSGRFGRFAAVRFSQAAVKSFLTTEDTETRKGGDGGFLNHERLERYEKESPTAVAGASGWRLGRG